MWAIEIYLQSIYWIMKMNGSLPYYSMVLVNIILEYLYKLEGKHHHFLIS